jgi:hypothetical protein
MLHLLCPVPACFWAGLFRSPKALVWDCCGNIAVTKMYITKTGDGRYHVEVRDPFTHEQVNGTQFLAMASGRTSPMPAVEILRLMDSQFVGYTMTVDYD